MKIYHYDSETGEHTNTTDAVVLPRREELSDGNPNKFQLPAHATFEAPPKTKTREAACWKGGKWTIVPDFRAANVYSRRTGEKVCLALGEQIVTAQHSHRPIAPSVEFLVEKREEKITEIAVEMALRSEEPIEADVGTDRHTFHADWVAAMRILLTLTTLRGDNVRWTPKGQDTPVEMTRAELATLLAQIVARMDALHTVKKQKERDVKRLTTLAEIERYDAVAGWADSAETRTQ